MWLSRKFSAYQAVQQESTAADLGVTTIGGGSAAVVTRGEQRSLTAFSPGGVVWQPTAGDTVLVIKGGVGCQERCIVGADTSEFTPEGMAEGELFLYSTGGATVHLKNDGSIAVKGNVSLEGNLEVKGDMSLTGDLDITGDVQLTGNLDLQGDTQLTGKTRVSGELVINGLLCPACGA